MPFKIIRTFENGKFIHWIAPAQWECNNVVKWPKNKMNELHKIENSRPGPDWKKNNCQVKRRNLITYDDAERELARMLAHTDTDEDGNEGMQNSSAAPINLNVLVEELIANQENIDPVNKSSEVQTVPNTKYQIISQSSFEDTAVVGKSQVILTNENDDCSYCVVTDESSFQNNNYENFDLKKIIENQEHIIANQNQILQYLIDNNNVRGVMLENQKKILLKVASLSVQVDDITLQLSNQNRMEVTPLGASKDKPENTAFSWHQISSVEELKSLENLLSDENARERLKNTLAIVCNEGGKGIDCAYILIDVMFSREFLTQCSWSGSSRSDGIKISLKCYKNIVSFFWHMIRTWDYKFTMIDNEIFFKNILKNANKRKDAKRERASSSRKRAKFDKQITNKSTETGAANATVKAPVESNHTNHMENKEIMTATGDVEQEPDEYESLC